MKKGEKFILTNGEYSDFGIKGSFCVLVDFSWGYEVTAWHKRTEDREAWRDSQEFLEELVSRGLIVEQPLFRVHMGAYGRLDEYAEVEARRRMQS